MSAGARLAGTPDPMHRWPGINGVTLAGDSWGPADGPLVLLLHGGGQTRHAWRGAGQALGDAGYRAVAFDARGHGDSDWAGEGNYGHGRMTEDLVALAARLGDTRPALVGASMGGLVSLEAVGDDLIDATALVLVDIAPRMEMDGVARILEFMDAKPDGFTSLEEVADAIAAYQPHRPRPTDLSGLAKNVRLWPDGRFRWHWDPAWRIRDPDREAMYERHAACARRLSLPTLLVRGGLSDVLSEDGAQSFLELVPHSEYVNVKEASHMVAGDRNDVFAGAVIEFLHRVVPPDGRPVQLPHPLHPHHEGPPTPEYDIP